MGLVFTDFVPSKTTKVLVPCIRCVLQGSLEVMGGVFFACQCTPRCFQCAFNSKASALRYLKSIIRDKVLKAAPWWRHGALCSEKPDIVESCVNEV